MWPACRHGVRPRLRTSCRRDGFAAAFSRYLIGALQNTLKHWEHASHDMMLQIMRIIGCDQPRAKGTIYYVAAATDDADYRRCDTPTWFLGCVCEHQIPRRASDTARTVRYGKGEATTTPAGNCHARERTPIPNLPAMQHLDMHGSVCSARPGLCRACFASTSGEPMEESHLGGLTNVTSFRSTRSAPAPSVRTEGVDTHGQGLSRAAKVCEAAERVN